jgi:hypothetical protein
MSATDIEYARRACINLRLEVESIRAEGGWYADDLYNGWLDNAWPHEHSHRLTSTQMAIASKLGISCEIYIEEMCRIECGSGGGWRR